MAGAVILLLGPVFIATTDYYDSLMANGGLLFLATVFVLFSSLVGLRYAANDRKLITGVGIGILASAVAIIPAFAFGFIIPGSVREVLGILVMFIVSMALVLVSLMLIWGFISRRLPNPQLPARGINLALSIAALPTLAIMAYAWSGYATADRSPCAQTAWSEADGSYRIRVLYRESDCKTLAAQYARFEDIDPSSDDVLAPGSNGALASAWLYLDFGAFSGLQQRELLAALGAAGVAPFPDMSIPPASLQADIAEYTVSNNGLGSYMLGGTGILVLNGKGGPHDERISKKLASGRSLTVTEARFKSRIENWDQILGDLKANGRPGEFVVLRNGSYAIGALDAPRHLLSGRNIEVMNRQGQRRMVNVDYMALIVLPTLNIDLRLPDELQP